MKMLTIIVPYYNEEKALPYFRENAERSDSRKQTI